MKLAIGVDDTDSRLGMCTTYLAALLKDELSNFCSVEELKLIRLNPVIPWKTRGNGACAVFLEADEGDYGKIKKTAVKLLNELSYVSDKTTNPGMVFLKEPEKIEGKLRQKLDEFYEKALHSIVSISEAASLAEKCSAEIYGLKNKRGIIGALAAIAAEPEKKTYEIIAYRKKENWGKERSIDENSVKEMDRKTRGITFNNIDYESGRVLIYPRSPCPVLFGIRAKRKEVLEKAMRMIKANEEIARYAIFTTNQATDAHLKECENISSVKANASFIVKGTVSREPEIIEGGHVIFEIADESSSIVCAAYKESGFLNKIARLLRKGDAVRVYGNVVKKDSLPLTINLEKLEILNLTEIYEERNPICICGKRTKSLGKDQGFRCKKCKRIYKNAGKEKIKIERELGLGIYSCSLSSMHHLTKPLYLSL